MLIATSFLANFAQGGLEDDVEPKLHNRDMFSGGYPTLTAKYPVFGDHPPKLGKRYKDWGIRGER